MQISYCLLECELILLSKELNLVDLLFAFTTKELSLKVDWRKTKKLLMSGKNLFEGSNTRLDNILNSLSFNLQVKSELRFVLYYLIKQKPGMYYPQQINTVKGEKIVSISDFSFYREKNRKLKFELLSFNEYIEYKMNSVQLV